MDGDMDIAAVVASSLRTAVWITSAILACVAATYIGRLFGRPIVRWVFGLAYSTDQRALDETGQIAMLVTALFCFATVAYECIAEEQRHRASGQSRYMEAAARGLVEAVLVVMILGVLTSIFPARQRPGEPERIHLPTGN
jgi:hypothetical protein